MGSEALSKSRNALTSGNLEYAEVPLTIQDVGIQARAASQTYSPTVLADCRLAQFLAFEVDNQLNQPIVVRIIGRRDDTPEGGDSSEMSGDIGVNANTKVGFHIDLDDAWMPYMGLEIITLGTAPTSGVIYPRAMVQRHKVG